jgi:hypothetical protein
VKEDAAVREVGSDIANGRDGDPEKSQPHENSKADTPDDSAKDPKLVRPRCIFLFAFLLYDVENSNN